MEIKKIVNYAYNGALRLWSEYEQKLAEAESPQVYEKIVNDLWDDLQEIGKLLHFLENNNF